MFKEPQACKADLNKFIEYIGGLQNAMWSLKLDGVRCVAVVDKTGVLYFSRAGKNYKNFNCFDEQLKQLATSAVTHKVARYPIIFDGEVASDDLKFKSVMTQTHRMKGVDTSALRFKIFDIMLEDIDLFRRYAILAALFNANKHSLETLQLVKHNLFGQGASGDSVLDILRRVVDMGHEGLVLKYRHGTYQHRRTIEWCKCVAQSTVDLLVTGMEPGKGKYSGVMGALICDYKGHEVRVGTGFDDAQRFEFMTNPPKLIEVAYREITESGSLRFPAFVRVRNDKTEPSYN